MKQNAEFKVWHDIMKLQFERQGKHKLCKLCHIMNKNVESSHKGEWLINSMSMSVCLEQTYLIDWFSLRSWKI